MPGSLLLMTTMRIRASLRITCVVVSVAVLGCGARDRNPSPHGRPVEPDTLVIAAVSMESRIREIDRNLDHVEYWARRAADAGAELALFPETTITGWWSSREIRKYAEPIDGPSIQRLIKLADELGIIIAVGMTEREGDKAYITHVLLNGDGVMGRHRKTELAGGQGGEGKVWDRGDDANVFDVKGAKIGIAICYESVHPETCAKLKANGAEIILAPYANGTDPDELLTGKRPYTYARAAENRVWYVACDAPPHDENGNLKRGAAYVISPQGELVAITSPDATGENMLIYPIPLSNN